jgi:biopolymer transport protein ExbB/TolQ
MLELIEKILLEAGPLYAVFLMVLVGMFYTAKRLVPRWIERMDRDAQLVRDLSEKLAETRADITAIRKEQETISQRDTQGTLRKLEAHMSRLVQDQEAQDQEIFAWTQAINSRLQRIDVVLKIIAAGGQARDDVRCGSSDCPAMQVLQPEQPNQPHNLMERERTDD